MIRQEANIDKTTGNLIEFKEYHDGQLILTELYDMDGNMTYKKTPKEEANYHMGKLHGNHMIVTLNETRFSYFNMGVPEGLKTYLYYVIKGCVNGIKRWYWPNGKIRELTYVLQYFTLVGPKYKWDELGTFLGVEYPKNISHTY